MYLDDDEWLEEPIRYSVKPDLTDADTLARILDEGDLMCRRQIETRYIKNEMTHPDNLVWTVRDATDRIFGFAITQHDDANDVLVMKVACTYPRKVGDGTRLIHNILRYARQEGLHVQLEAINQRVALMYARHARRFGYGVLVDDRDTEPTRTELERVLHSRRVDIPMFLIHPSTRSRLGAPRRRIRLSVSRTH